MPIRFSISELSEATGLNRRLIHDYIARELIPRPHGSGKGAYYDEEHYLRLRLVSLLKGMGLRLERIGDALEGWSMDEIRQIVDAAEGQDPESLSELHDWLAIGITSAGLLEEEAAKGAMAADLDVPAFASPGQTDSGEFVGDLFSEATSNEEQAQRQDRTRKVSDYDASLTLAADAAIERPQISSRELWARRAHQSSSPRRALPSREQWTRVHLAPGVELSYREGMSALVEKKLKHLRTIAEELFGLAPEE